MPKNILNPKVKQQRTVSRKYNLSKTDRTIIILRGVTGHSEDFSRKREGKSVNKLLSFGILEKKPIDILPGFFNFSLTTLGWEIHDQIFTNQKV